MPRREHAYSSYKRFKKVATAYVSKVQSMPTQEFREEIKVTRDEEGIPKKVLMQRKGTEEEISKVDRGQVQIIIILLRDILWEMKEIKKTLKSVHI